MLRIFIVLVWLPFQLLGQLNEDFTDGNFTSQPEWVGQNAHFGVTNDGWLQLIAPAEAANSYLFTPSAVAENGSWRFKLKMDFNPSSSNYARIYLMADGASPLTIRNAVYVEMGNTTDDICLYYLLNGKVEKIIDGVDGTVNTSVVNTEVKISAVNNTWVLESNTSGTWQRQGSVTKRCGFGSSYAGVVFYYTATRSNKFWFDDFYIEGQAYVDKSPPLITEVKVVNSYILTLKTNKTLATNSIGSSNFKFSNLNSSPQSISNNAETNTLSVHFFPGLSALKDEPFSISKLKDLVGNALVDTTVLINYIPTHFKTACLTNDSTLNLTFTQALTEENLRKSTCLVDDKPMGFKNISKSSDQCSFLVTLQNKVPKGQTLRFDITSLVDARGDTLSIPSQMLMYYQAVRFDVLFSEVMTDPSPPMGQPETEYIELYNASPFSINTTGWILKVNKNKVTLPSITIPSNQYICLYSSSYQTPWPPEINAFAVAKWSALTNEKVQLALLNESGQVIDAFQYISKDIPGEPFKREGGWSTERTNYKNVSGHNDNWVWCKNRSGGTPGQVNSMSMEVIDIYTPFVKYYTYDNNQLFLYFSETMDLLNPDLKVSSVPSLSSLEVAAVDTVFLRWMKINVQPTLTTNELYELKLTSLTDLSKQTLVNEVPIVFGTADRVEAGDVLLNEILFNPVVGGVDFVELYNNSSKIINLKNLSFAKFENEVISSLVPITSENRLLLPYQYFVVSPDSSGVLNQYRCINPHAILTVASLPSMSDDEGTVALCSSGGQELDVFSYQTSNYATLLKNADGVSLERLSPLYPTNDANNWSYAAAAVGYATPTYQNSVAISSRPNENELSLEPETFSPNGDGYNDLLLIKYTNSEPAGTATVRIFNRSGQLVKGLVNNELMSSEGFFTWNGFDESGQKLPPGSYIIWISRFYPSGRVSEKKMVCVLSPATL